MYNDDYIIAIDENGQPYIAHAFGDGYRRAKAKYLDKVRTKSGAWRYLYTPEEVAALGRERRAKKAGVKDTQGLQEYQTAQYEANKARSRVKSNRAQLKKNISNAPTKAKNKVKDWAGYDERESRDIARKNYWASKNKYGPNKGEGSKTRHLRDVAETQQAKYDKTLLGKVEKTKSRMKRAKSKARITMTKYKNTTLANIRDWNETRKNRRQNKKMDNNGGR